MAGDIRHRGRLDKSVQEDLEYLRARISTVSTALPQQPILLQAYHSAAQTIPDATWTDVLFNGHLETAVYDTVDEAPSTIHNVSVLSQNFNIPTEVAGLVRIRATVGFAANATGSRGLVLMKNGGWGRGSMTFVPAATAVGATVISLTWMGKATAADIFKFQVYQNSGGNLDIGSASAEHVQSSADFEFRI